MQLRKGQLCLSPSDLAAHLGCGHRTELERQAALKLISRPKRFDPFLEALILRGREHEEAFVRRLEATGRSVVDLAERRDPDATRAAMQSGADVIVQAALNKGRYLGIADVLLRIEHPSSLGSWSYEPADTKLTRETKAGTILQLCAYAEFLEEAQGVAPENLYVVTPLGEERYRRAEYDAYFRFVQRRLESAVDGEQGSPATYPEPVTLCDTCSWWSDCDRRRRADDHLSLVAGITSTHRRELGDRNVATVVDLAGLSTPIAWKPLRGTIEVFERLRHQAELQVRARSLATPPYELLERVDGRGLARLPAPSPGDVFLDFEGDPFVGPNGLEYVTGWSCQDGDCHFRAETAFTVASEKRAFEAFMDDVSERLTHWPDGHVYTFGAYERAALGRLASRHATRQDELDQLLRGGRMIDLHSVVKEAMRVGVERYGLKELETLTRFVRATDLAEAGHARRHIELALELGETERIDPELVERVIAYNREDCLSTARLRQWLEDRRAELIAGGETIPRPQAADPQASPGVLARDARIAAVATRLLEGVPDEPSERDEKQQGRWSLAQLIGYFRREEKVAYWEHFRLRELAVEELLEEREALSGLAFDAALPSLTATGRLSKTPIHRYRFPPQESALDSGDEVRLTADSGADPCWTIERVDPVRGTVDVRKTAATGPVHPTAIFRYQVVRIGDLETSILAFGEKVAHEVGTGLKDARLDLLLRRPPRRKTNQTDRLLRDGEDEIEAGTRLCLELDSGVLAVQGPPGTGKTYGAARMIVELVRRGKRVGVTAVSHKVIDNLLTEVAIAADKGGIQVRLVHKSGGRSDGPVEYIDDNPGALATVGDGCVVGGTAWFWARNDAEGVLDFLFVDEAGQMALAQVLAAARAATNLVLFGDPQQLEQPRRGAHPEGADVAALSHVLGPGTDTLPSQMGLFLENTRRLHPSICSFTSELYYEGRLSSAPGCEHQMIGGQSQFAGCGLFLVELLHHGNQASAPEEVDTVTQIIDGLLDGNTTWTDCKQRTRPLAPDDILVVAPYNAQVTKLGAALTSRGVDRVGTVDRFQGQEAPVVIYSCTSSSTADAPRGLNFLYDPHRFNVATSRARGAVIVVASPRLFEPETRTPAQMRMANGFCRYRELAQPIFV